MPSVCMDVRAGELQGVKSPVLDSGSIGGEKPPPVRDCILVSDDEVSKEAPPMP